MTVSKLTNNVKPLDEVDKINEIIDELDNIDPLPSQTGQSGKYLTTNGTVPSWAEVQSLPSQTGHTGLYLQTDGTDASWQGVPGRNIGEIVASTIPLTDAGLHLLDGALIQGNGIYSAFVDYIAGLYEADPTANYFAQIEDKAWTQPILSANGTLGGDSFAVSASSIWSSSYPAYKAVDGNTSTWWASSASTSADFIFYNPDPIKVTQLSWSSHASEYTTQGTIYGSNDNSTWTEITNYTNNSANITINMSSNTAYYKYYKISSTAASGDFSIIELTITATYSTGSAEASWQHSITRYGVCGKFVYDSVNNTVRLPKYNSKIYTGGGTAPVVGNGKTVGLTNGTTNYGLFSTNGSSNNSSFRTLAYGTNVGYLSDAGVESPTAYTMGITTDGTKSGLVAQLSDITTSLDGYYYIVIATSTKTDIQVDIDEVVTDLNGKADTDLLNVPASKGILTESYVNGTSWYRVYSDGWCEQGGYAMKGSEGWLTISLLKSFVDTNYNLSVTPYTTNTSTYMAHEVKDKTISNFAAYMIVAIDWHACGYIR